MRQDDYNTAAMQDAIDEAIKPPESERLPYMVTAKEQAERWGCTPQTARRRMKASKRFKTAYVLIDGTRCAVYWLPEAEEEYNLAQRGVGGGGMDG
jgi:hypothetical protein